MNTSETTEGERDRYRANEVEELRRQVTIVTHVTRWGVPEAKCTRRYGAISVQLLKNPELNSHAEHHKRMGTRLGQLDD